MSKLNEIESELKKIGQGKLQKLGDTYFYHCGYEKITSWGSVEGQDKTRPGIPDSYIELSNGNYIFIEYTAQKSKIFEKFKVDLEKDLNQNKVGIPAEKIEKIFIFYNSKLHVSQVEKLQTICESKGVSFENYNINKISFDLCYKFPSIAKEYLSVQIDTNQILSLDDFIKEASNKPFTPSLDNKFLFREKEIKQIINSLSNNTITIIQGKPGVGKTRVSIEACNQFIETHKDYNIKFIVDKSRVIDDDLVTYFSNPDKKFVIFIDDANRQSALEKIFHLTRENPDRIKLILTVRDYAYQKTIKTIEQYFESFDSLTISEFNNAQIKAILKELNITNPLWIDRIWELSKGNARIALMAANAGKKIDHIVAIANIEDIYNKYFDTITKDVSDINIKVLGIISYFRIIDLKEENFMQSITQNFRIHKNDFIENSIKLHDLELIDMWEDEIVKISDQVLQTFMFYKSFIKDKLLDFSVILKHYYDGEYKEKIRDVVYSSLNSFDFRFIKNKLLPHLNDKFALIKDNKTELIAYYELFWLLKPTETLEFINDEINKLPICTKPYNGELKSADIFDNFINILRKFINTNEENFLISIQLLFEYVQRKSKITPQVLYYIEHDINFKRYSHNLHYKQQLMLINYLFEDLKTNKILDIIRLYTASHFSNIIYSDNWMTTKHEFTWTNFSLILRNETKEIRTKIWNFLIYKFSKDFERKYIFGLFQNYLQQIKYKSQAKADIEVVKFDSEFILKFISCLKATNLTHCIFVHDYLNALNKLEIKENKFEKIKAEFSTKIYQLYQTFTKEFWELKDYKESEKKKKELLIFYVKDYNFDDYVQLLDDYADLKQQVTSKDWIINESLRIILRHIFETDFNLFYELIKHLIQRENFILLQPYFFISDLLSSNYVTITEFYGLLKYNEYEMKEEWMISFFQSLPEEKITKFYYDELIIFLKNFDKPYLDLRLDFLIKYKQFDKVIFINVIKILYKKVSSGTKVNFRLLFNPHLETYKNLQEIFKNDLNLFKKIYLYQKSNDIYNDYESKVLKQILEVDFNFIIEYLNWMNENKDYLTDMDDHNNYSSLWKATNYEKIFDKILEYFSKDPDFFFASHHHINVFFRKRKNSTNDKIVNYLKNKLKKSEDNIILVKLLFVIITNNFPNERIKFIKIFLKINKNIKDFRNLYLELDSMSGGATFVPIYKERIKFWESVRDFFSSAEFLKHRRYTEEVIQDYQKRITYDQRRNFRNDF